MVCTGLSMCRNAFQRGSGQRGGVPAAVSDQQRVDLCRLCERPRAGGIATNHFVCMLLAFPWCQLRRCARVGVSPQPRSHRDGCRAVQPPQCRRTLAPALADRERYACLLMHPFAAPPPQAGLSKASPSPTPLGQATQRLRPHLPKTATKTCPLCLYRTASRGRPSPPLLTRLNPSTPTTTTTMCGGPPLLLAPHHLFQQWQPPV